MSLQARLDALEEAVRLLLPAGHCSACGYPSSNLPPVMLLAEGEAPARCRSCGRLVDVQGRTLETGWASRQVPVEWVQLHERRGPVALPVPTE